MLQKVALIAGSLFIVFVTAAIVMLFSSVLLMYCWNAVVPSVFGLIRLGWWQAWCLQMVAFILIKSGNAVSSSS